MAGSLAQTQLAKTARSETRNPGQDQQLYMFTDLSREWELDHFDPPIYEASIFYMKPTRQYEVEKPYFMNIPIDPTWAPNIKQTNVSYTRKTVAVSDIRGHEDIFSLDKNGFQIGHLRSRMLYHDFGTSEAIVSRYYKEVVAFLIQYTGACEVVPFDFQVRRNDPSLPSNSRGAPGKAQPFGAVHGDQTINAAIRRLHHFHPEQAQKYSHGRFQIINVWKPLRGPVRDSPLAVCDYRTVKDEDRVPTDIVFPDYLGETYNFWPNPCHRFYYIDGQGVDEAWMIKCFDSLTMTRPDVAQFAPHVSFPYRKDCQELEPLLRESIEVRTFVFFK